MASPATDQSAGALNDTYEKNPMNNSSYGKDFETNVAIYTLLTSLQSDEQAMAIEYIQAPAKFDDVVLRFHNGSGYEFYYRQLKHRDLQMDSEDCLTWNVLLKSKKTPKDYAPFGIPWYFEQFLKQKKTTALEDVKELAFVTNYNLVNKQLTEQETVKKSNLKELAQTLLYASVKETKYPITEKDLGAFFQECRDQSAWRPPSSDQKSYKFTEEAIEAIFEGAQAGWLAAKQKLDLSSYKQFLRLIVFRVSMPHVSRLKEINQRLLKVFLPFHKNFLDDRYEDITKMFMHLFESTKHQREKGDEANNNGKGYFHQALWATSESRLLFLEEVAKQWKTNSSIDFSTSFCPAYCEPEPAWSFIIREMSGDRKSWEERQPMRVVNIFNGDSNPTVITLKLFKYLETKLLMQTRTTVIKQITDKNSFDNTIEYFVELDQELSDCFELVERNFYCIIQVSQFFKTFDGWGSVLAHRLSGFANLRKFIRYLVITQLSIPVDDTELQRIEDTPLQWHHLSNDFKKQLFGKTLFLGQDKETSLRALGFEEKNIGKWLSPKALAELIVHVKETPLNLGLPEKDTNLGADYIEREIQLPLVKNDMKAQRAKLFTLNENGFHGDQYQGGFQHLLSPVKSNHPDACLWVRSKENRSILQHKEYVISAKDSDYTVHEKDLLEDNVNFGTGSTDNKLLVIVDLPGKGKSFLLTSLSNRFNDDWLKHPNELLLRVNLREIKNWTLSESALMFLLDHSKELKRNSTDKNASLAISILHHKYNSDQPSIFVLLDGYDEISDEQRKATLATTDKLVRAKGIKRVILTSRPESTLEKELEDHFRQLPLHLKNFDRESQVCYLTKRWESKLEKIGALTGSIGKIAEFAEALVDFAGGVLKDENKTFLDIPLQCWIFSECFFQQLVQYITSSDNTAPQFDENNFKILNLYDRFYQAKIDVLLHEKASIPQDKNEALFFLRNEMMERFLGSMMRLSIIHMTGEIIDAALICNMNWDVYRSKIKKYHDEEEDGSEFDRDLKRAMKLGVVQCPMYDKSYSDIEPRDIRFLHRTFAEYFFARALLLSFIQEKSDLFDGSLTTMSTLTTSQVSDFGWLQDKRFDLISEKIFASTEFAGVRRFLDGMLAKYLPSTEERCPFAHKESRTVVLKKWPTFGHEQFNQYFAETVIRKNETKLTELPFYKTEASKLAGRDFEILRNQINLQEGLGSIRMRNFEKSPNICSMLIHCIKEYACRSSTTDEHREILAYSFTISLLTWVLGNPNEHQDELKNRITQHLLRWFERGTESLSGSNLLSKWFFIFFNALTRESNARLSKIDSNIVSVCAALRQHSVDPDFNDNIYSMASSMFTTACEHPHVKAYQFFRVDLLVDGDLFEDKNRISDVFFQGFIVSLSAHNVLSTDLLQRIADMFILRLKKYIALLTKARVDYAGNVKNTTTTRVNSYGKCIEENIVHPKGFNQTVEFFINNATKLPETTNSELLKAVLEYVIQIQQSMFEMSRQVDFLFIPLNDGSQKRARLGMTREVSNAVTYKIMTTSLMFLYFFPADLMISNLLDAQERKKASVNVFFTEIGQSSLTACAFADCCCECNYVWFTGFGIHFPRKTHDSDKKNNEFGDLLSGKLAFLWKDLGEIAFIDFLMLNGVDFQLDAPQSNLRAIHLAKLPCLLFSDGVSKYIQRELSLQGFKHLAETLKKVPFFTCQNICYKSYPKKQPDISDENMTLWDGIMQGELHSLKFKCKQAHRVKVLREKLQEATSAQQ